MKPLYFNWQVRQGPMYFTHPRCDGKREWVSGGLHFSIHFVMRSSMRVCGVCALYLLVYFLCGLSVTEGDSRQVFQDGHLHGAVAPVQQRHQGARMHWPVHDLGPNTWREVEERRMIIQGTR